MGFDLKVILSSTKSSKDASIRSMTPKVPPSEDKSPGSGNWNPCMQSLLGFQSQLYFECFFPAWMCHIWKCWDFVGGAKGWHVKGIPGPHFLLFLYFLVCCDVNGPPLPAAPNSTNWAAPPSLHLWDRLKPEAKNTPFHTEATSVKCTSQQHKSSPSPATLWWHHRQSALQLSENGRCLLFTSFAPKAYWFFGKFCMCLCWFMHVQVYMCVNTCIRGQKTTLVLFLRT